MSTLCAFDSVLPCDCVEALSSCPSLLAIGCYLLDKDAGIKTGALHFVETAHADRGVDAPSGADAPQPSLRSISRTETTTAIFDARW